jgi:hypothetical protein
MVFSRDDPELVASATLLGWLKVDDSWSSDPGTKSLSPAGLELLPIFFLILPLIERIDPRETREGDVSLVLIGVSAEETSGPEVEWSRDSGSETNDEAIEWLSSDDDDRIAFEGEVTFVGPSLPLPLSPDPYLLLKTLFISVEGFLMKELPRFFLVGSS